MIHRMALFMPEKDLALDCVEAMVATLSPQYNIKIFNWQECGPELFKDIDIVAFPGGLGDSDLYYDFFRRRAANAVADFVEQGGYYLGICMGAYWAGKYYFDILDGIEVKQYIKRPDADVRRSWATTANVTWNDQPETMYFYDGCALLGDETKFETVARYANGDPMAVIQNRIGLIGCHPESDRSWYNRSHLHPHWHHGRHNQLLLDFVNRLIKK